MKQTSISTIPGLVLLSLALSSAAWGQTHSIDLFSINGGGGTSTGSVFSVSGTIGQPNAGASSGPTYKLVGGFWAIGAVQSSGGPPLSITASSGNVIISWPAPSGGFTLQQTSDLGAGNWINVTAIPETVSGRRRITVTPAMGHQFYRLKN
jgi:hypothetical protein